MNRGKWVDVTDPRMYGLPGKAGESLRVGGGSSVVLDRFPRGDFDGLSVQVQVIAPDAHWSVQYIPYSRDIEINAETGRLMACHLEGRQWMTDHGADCPQKKEYLMTILLVEGEAVVYVDGVETLRFKESMEKVAGLRLTVFDGSASFSQIRLRKKE